MKMLFQIILCLNLVPILDGTFTVTGIGTTTYNFDLDNTSLTTSFDRTTSESEYETSSKCIWFNQVC